MKTIKYMLRDENEGTYDIFIFEKEVEIEEIEKSIEQYKEKNPDTWTIESLIELVETSFETRETISFWDYDSKDIYFVK